MNHYTPYLLLFFIVGYLIVTNENNAKAFTLFVQVISFQYEKIKFLILHHPANPLVSWMIQRRAWRIAQELQRELVEKTKTV